MKGTNLGEFEEIVLLIVGVLYPEAYAVAIQEELSFKEMMEYASSVKRNNRQAAASTPKDVSVLDVQDQTTCAKITAWWGTDYLLLGKYDNQWKIVHVLWQSKPTKKP